MKRIAVSLGLIGFAVAAAHAAPRGRSNAELIANAISAAPAEVGRGAAVIRPDEHGRMITLRNGTNGWTCMPDDPGTPGDDPMCLDKNGMLWAAAWMAHKPPPADAVGLSYMLKGGSDASNLDPFATKPAPGGKWVTTGPHIMILNARVAAASGYPTKQPNPDTKHPYVMFGGTPYEHIMMPVR